ncbi:Uncharacterised protein [Clostridium novyi]|nr:Uncharacterised protein [Clostridium novyi]SUY37871.1 Uncharacterised protein [Clostridium perfringens]
MRGRKVRDIDYSYSELCDDLGIKSKNFKNTKKI